MANTFGIRSVNVQTFNLISGQSEEIYPQRTRDIIVTLLRIHNLILNIGGYSKFSFYSGHFRMVSGTLIGIVAPCIGNKDIGEGLMTAAAQIMRGVIEAYGPRLGGSILRLSYKTVLLISLDIIGTIKNAHTELKRFEEVHNDSDFEEKVNATPDQPYHSDVPKKYDDPDFPFPLNLLDLPLERKTSDLFEFPKNLLHYV